MSEDIATAATAATAPGAPAALLANRYEVLGMLGAGGMGRVYRALDRTLDEVVALKLLRRELVDVPGMLDRFRREVKIARRVTNPHVVRTFDLGTHGDDHFLTMEYVDGRSLAQVLEEGVPSLDETVRIARAIAAGMSAAHASDVLHRDLKPDNILVAKAGRIAITDFGIARLAAGPQVTGDRLIGTPAYMAPEQVEGVAELGAAADVYAAGAILFEMVTGRRPFAGDDPFAVALARLRLPPPDPRAVRAVPDALAELIVRCLARDPASRFRDGGELAAALATLDVHAASTQRNPSFAMTVPAKQSRAVAILPLHATGELAEVAEGLSEEIVDALTMTRALRVRPLASVRAASREDVDARELGQRLGVDVVVDGSIRRRGPQIRIAARAIGVADGFQLWASYFDTGPDGLLAAGDEVVRAIARALVVELDVPARAGLDARIAERYLEGKARLRAGWIEANIAPAIATLEEALPDAPDDPRILATLAMALARSAFFGITADLPRAQHLAERAIALAPASGEARFALALTRLYAGDTPRAAAMLRDTVLATPGLALAQGTLGALLLEAGVLEGAIMHLEAAVSIDPAGTYAADLARAYVYADRLPDAERVLEAMPGPHVWVETAMARFHMWRGEEARIDAPIPDGVPVTMRAYLEIAKALYARRDITEPQIAALKVGVHADNPRLRAARAQYACEYFVFAGNVLHALEMLRLGVAAGLQDRQWIEHCPLLAPLRELPEYPDLAAQIIHRAQAVVDALGPLEG